MEEKYFPTGKDIYIEIDGLKVAVVSRYKLRTKRNINEVWAFGENEPIGVVEQSKTYEIEFEKVYFKENIFVSDIDIYDKKDFNLTIVKPDRRVIYTGCNWQEIVETSEISNSVTEKIVVFAKSKKEIK